MLIHTAHLVCRPDVVEAFRERLSRHAQASVEREEGCHLFDVHQETRIRQHSRRTVNPSTTDLSEPTRPNG